MNVDELEQELLRAARNELAPSHVERERHRAQLATRLARGGLDDRAPLEDASAPRPWMASGAFRRLRAPTGLASWKPLSVGLVVGAVLGGVLGYGFGRSSSLPAADARRSPTASGVAPPGAADLAPRELAGAEAPTAREAAKPPAVGTAPEAIPVAPVVSDAVDEVETPLDGDSASGERRAGAGDSGKERAPERASAPPPGSSLAAELALLQRARRALNAQNGRLALGIVRELDERFARGLLLEERGATRILSLCMLDRREEAQRFARAFLQRYPASVYAERVQNSCVADAAP